jgi:hypothetical protein
MWAYFIPGSGGIHIPQNYLAAVPIELAGSNAFGHFWLINTRPMHWYVGRRVYDDVFYAPNDRHGRLAAPFFGDAWEFTPPSISGYTTVVYSSYCYSPAAMFDPRVMRAPSAGGTPIHTAMPTASARRHILTIDGIRGRNAQP